MRTWLFALILLTGLAMVLLPGCSALVGVDFGSVHLPLDADTPDPPPSEGGARDGGRDGCVPKTCAQLGFSCGTQNDGCNDAIECGTCSSGLCQSGTCQCQPKSCKELGVSCGSTFDGCHDNLECGSCDAPDVCELGGDAGASCACKPKTCAELHATCGNVPDGCGDTLSCGMCMTGDNCGGGEEPNQCGPATCVPTTCAMLGFDCGSASDGCGHTLSCGTCTGVDTCGGGGKTDVCGCTPTTCAAQGKNCGSIADGCGGMLSCGSCTSPDTCAGGGTSNVCGCTPTTCAALGANCGAPSNGCGGSLSCGSCTGVDTCGGGGTPDVCGCTPSTCAELGDTCGAPPNGCGGTLASCGLCPVDESCLAYHCTVSEGCFPAGEPVTMADGSSRPIERVLVGEWVRSYDPETRAFVRTVVLETRHHAASETSGVLLRVNGGLRVTPNHPFFTPTGNKRADALVLGDAIVSIDARGRPKPDGVRTLEILRATEEVYDLVVGSPGNYLVHDVLLVVKPLEQ
jgi:hypothetical protein